MKTMQIEMPDKLAAEVNELVQGGWFDNEVEVVHLAVAEFVRRYRFVLMEQFQREDIVWALKQKQSAQP